jgi:protoporphyrinogen IX oxidase
MESYNYIKALHLIFVITWFAGLFYIVRLFVYHAEAKVKSELEQRILIPQYQLMEYRLWYIITWPSAILATLFALVLLWFMPGFLQMDWMQVKLVFVVFLWLYHLKCHAIFSELQKDEVRYSSNFFRLWNEGATIILFAVIFLIVLKNSINWIYGVVGIILFSVLIMLGYKFYKKLREKKQS